MGISGHSSDMRDIIEEMESGNDRARKAFEVFSYRVKKYIGSYAAAMGAGRLGIHRWNWRKC